MTGPKPPTTSQLAFIQLSLVMGPVLFFGVTYFVRHQPGFTPVSNPLPDGVQYLLPVVFVLALGGVFIVRNFRTSSSNDQQFATFSLIGWAVAEAAALLGCVYFFLNGDPKWAITGIFVQLFSVVLLPAKRPT